MLTPEIATCIICKSDFMANHLPELPSDICPKCQGYYIAETNKTEKHEPKNSNNGRSVPFYISDYEKITLGFATGTVSHLPPKDRPFSLFKTKVDNFEKRIGAIEKKKIKEFERQDVYTVYKKIERLEQKIALLESNISFPLMKMKFLGALLVALILIMPLLVLLMR